MKLNYQKYILFQVKLKGKTAVLKTAHQKSQGNEKTENVESSPSIKKNTTVLKIKQTRYNDGRRKPKHLRW